MGIMYRMSDLTVQGNVEYVVNESLSENNNNK
jgi:hypothetical protein